MLIGIENNAKRRYFSRSYTWLCISLAVFFLLLAAVAPAVAHTRIVESEPGRGEELDRAPEQVKLFFEGPVEAEFSPLEVYNEQGERVDGDDAGLDPADPTVLTVGLGEDLPEGPYTVEYRYTGVDGHVIEGSYEFSLDGESQAEGANAQEANAQEANAQEANAQEANAQDPAAGGAQPAEASGGGFAATAIYILLGVSVLVLLVAAVFRRGKA